MRLLLDECVPRAFRVEFKEHDCHHVTSLGWSGLKNGQLLAKMQEGAFACILTVDRNLSFQQDITSAGVSVLLLLVPTNRIEDVLPLAPEARRVLGWIQPGQFIRIGA